MIRLLIVCGFLLFLPLAGSAVTLQGTDTVAMQGGGATVLPSADGDELDESFSVDPAWSATGTVTQNTGEVVTTQNGGSDFVDSPLQTVRTEYWLQFDVKYDSGGTFSTSGTHNGFGGGLMDSGNNDRVLLGNLATGTDGSTGDWRVYYRDDTGRQLVETGVAMKFDEWLTCVMHFKSATAPGNNDGVVQVWIIDSAQNVETLLDLANVDNDSLTARNVRFNNFSSNGGQSLISHIDNIKMGTSGRVYVP